VQSKYTNIKLEVDTFTMPCVDETLDADSGEVEHSQRLINGIVISITKN
jgi:hypothetical protein